MSAFVRYLKIFLAASAAVALLGGGVSFLISVVSGDTCDMLRMVIAGTGWGAVVGAGIAGMGLWNGRNRESYRPTPPDHYPTENTPDIH